MKSKDLYRLEPGSYRFKSVRFAIEKWFGVWELFDLNQAHQSEPIGKYKTLKEAVRAVKRQRLVNI
jgi:hypothetical protein